MGKLEEVIPTFVVVPAHSWFYGAEATHIVVVPIRSEQLEARPIPDACVWLRDFDSQPCVCMQVLLPRPSLGLLLFLRGSSKAWGLHSIIVGQPDACSYAAVVYHIGLLKPLN